MKDAHAKMVNYCIHQTCLNILNRYQDFKPYWGFTFGLIKKKPLLSWCSDMVEDCFFKHKRAQKHAWTWTYEGAIRSYLLSANSSKDNTVYVSDEALTEIEMIKYRTTNEKLLEEMNKFKEQNKELWEYVEKNVRF